MKYLKGFHVLRTIVGYRKLFAFFLRATKKAIYLDQGRQGLDQVQIDAARKLFSDIADNYRTALQSQEPINKTLYMFWWTGFENAPEIVRVCLKSVRKFYPDYHLVLIDQTNVQSYIPAEDIVLKRFQKGWINVQNFSDYLRFYLMYHHGGYWIDATMFFTRRFDLDELLVERDFTSIGFSTLSRCFFSQGVPTRWADFFYGARKGAPLCKAFVECFQRYYIDHDYPFDYFMMDCILFLFMERGVENNILDKIPCFTGSCVFTFPTYGINAKATPRALYETSLVPQKLNRKIDVGKLKKDGLLYALIRNLED